MTYRKLFYLFAFVFVLNACSKHHDDNPSNPEPNPNPPVTTQGVQFDTSGQYFGDTTLYRVTVHTKDPVSKDVSVKITYTSKGYIYAKNFTTTPASDNGIVLLTIPAGKKSAYFDVKTDPSYLRDGGDEIRYKLDSAGTSMPLGSIREQVLLSLGFVEKYIDMNRGDNGKNRVFINFDKLTATAIDRNSWDLGFYTGQEDHRVILNAATGMLAYRLDKNDLATVSAADTVGLIKTQTTYLNVDNPNGDLTKTAIAAISATPEDNKVYIINRRPGIGNPATGAWKKVRILRNASGGYTLQQADIASTTYYSVNITKDDAYYFNYISFENGAVTGEPKKEDWDIVWTSSTVSRKGPEETPLPHFQNHVLHQNRNTKLAMGPSEIDYQKFSNGDVTGLTFNTYKTFAGFNWTPSGSGGEYYIIRTSRNTIYKFRIQDFDANPYITSVTFKPLK
jgi:hypothetical protein